MVARHAWWGACCQWGHLLVIMYQGVVHPSPLLFLAHSSGTSCAELRRFSRSAPGMLSCCVRMPITGPLIQEKWMVPALKQVQ